MKLAVVAAGFGEVTAGTAALGFTGAVLYGGVMLVTVAAGVDLAFAAVALAGGAEALGGVSDRQRDKYGKRCKRGDGEAPQRYADWPADLRIKKATTPVCSEVWPGELMGWLQYNCEKKFVSPEGGDRRRDMEIPPCSAAQLACAP